MCRSPAAEGLLAQHFGALGIDANAVSAGTRATLGAAAPEVIQLLERRGIDMRGFVSRQLTAELALQADLVICMAREHLRETVLLDPALFARTFTLKELVRRAVQVGACGPDEAIPTWLERVGEGRQVTELLGDDPTDDVVDPIGQRFAVFESVVTEIDALVRSVAGYVSLGVTARP